MRNREISSRDFKPITRGYKNDCFSGNAERRTREGVGFIEIASFGVCFLSFPVLDCCWVSGLDA